MKKTPKILLAILAIALAPQAHSASITNGSFESGFTGWGTADLAVPFSALNVTGSGFSTGFGLFTTAPTDGLLAAVHGFDGSTPGVISFFQDVGVIDTNSAVVTFTLRAGWDMVTYNGGGEIDRVFSVVVSPAGGGAPLASYEVLRAQHDTQNFDTGSLAEAIDLSAHIGSDVRLSFEAFIPEAQTGPALMQIDNIALGVAPVPFGVDSTTGLALLGLASAWKMRRRNRS